MNRTLTRAFVLALATTGLPTALALSAASPAAAAPERDATDCSGTIAVTDLASGDAIGWFQAPGGTYGYTGYTADAASATDLYVTRGADGYFSITTFAGGVVGGENGFGRDMQADRADYAILKTDPGLPADLWSLDGNALTASWTNSDGSRVPLHLFDNDDDGGGSRNDYLGGATNLPAMEDYFESENFPEVTFTLQPAAGADCSFAGAACDDARDAFAAAKVKMQAAKQRLRDAHDSGNQHAIDKAKAHKQKVRAQRADAKADVQAEC